MRGLNQIATDLPVLNTAALNRIQTFAGGARLTLTPALGLLLIACFAASIGVAQAQAQAASGHPSVLATLWKWMPLILKGFVFNIAISFLAMAIGTFFGMFLGLAQISLFRPVRKGAWFATHFFRNAPWLVLLFYCMFLLPFKFTLFGVTEFAARLVPALSAIGVIATTFWAGKTFFNRQDGHEQRGHVAVLPATFALSAIAILDMTFTAFVFAGVVFAASAALHDRPRRQWWGYLCIALAVLTKGPLAIALAGLSFGLALAIAPRVRARLLSLRWITGLAMVIAIASPWFIYMWLRFL